MSRGLVLTASLPETVLITIGKDAKDDLVFAEPESGARWASWRQFSEMPSAVGLHIDPFNVMKLCHWMRSFTDRDDQPFILADGCRNMFFMRSVHRTGSKLFHGFIAADGDGA